MSINENVSLLTEKEIQKVFDLLELKKEKAPYFIESEQNESKSIRYIIGLSDSSVPAPLWGYKNAKLERNT